MDQLRQIGEVIGSIRALMVLKHDIQINQKQCCLLFDVFSQAFETISEEIKLNLKFGDKNTKWKPLEAPLKELHWIFREGELYVKTCLEIKDWWGKAVLLHQSKDCVEFHIHNLLSCFPLVIEAIELATEVSGVDEEDMQRRKFVLARKYDVEWNDPRFFEWKFGRQYLVNREMRVCIDRAWKEDKWALLDTMREKKGPAHTLTVKQEEKLETFLVKKVNGEEVKTLLPSSILIGAQDYYVKRRLGSGGSHHKEIQWLGESFALKTFFGDIEPLKGEISLVLSLSHPNVLQYLCGFYDQERKEGFLVMELMQKSLLTYIKENCSQRKRVPFSLPVAVDIMLQIARGMEYLHSRKIYHGDLNPSNILLKARSLSPEGYFHAKVKGFGLISIKSFARASPKQSEVDPVIWYAPEVLAEQVRPPNKCSSKYTEKADVYSFAMLCFELLTGKVPFEDSHLQGDKMVRNIRAGERPLFPHPFPKYLANLTRKCWQNNPFHRPSFSSICRILRYIKKILVINPDHGHPESPPPLVDYVDLEAGYSKKYPEDGSFDLAPVYQIPFQMFVYRLVEKEKSSDSSRETNSWESLTDERTALVDDLLMGTSDRRSTCSEILERKNSFLTVVDQRSVFSEAPQRKLFSLDQASVCSESPGRRFYSPGFAETPDRKSFGSVFAESPGRLSFGSPFAETPENKILTRAATLPSIVTVPKSVIQDNQGEKKSVNGADSKSMGSLTPERKFSSTKSPKERSVGFNIQEEKPSPVSPPVSKTLFPAKKDTKPQQPPDAKTLNDNSITTNPNSKVLPEISEKKDFSTQETDQKVFSSKTQDKKLASTEKPTEKTKDTKSSKLVQAGTTGQSPKASPAQKPKAESLPKSSPAQKPKAESSPKSSLAIKPKADSSPKSSPSQTPRWCSSPKPSARLNQKGYSSPRSSPARVLKDCSSPGSSPARVLKGCSSPARVFKDCSSPGSSPARVLKGCSSPGSSHIWAPNICSSPRSSPLNPSGRCTRMNKEGLTPPTDMSPKIQQRGLLSEFNVE